MESGRGKGLVYRSVNSFNTQVKICAFMQGVNWKETYPVSGDNPIYDYNLKWLLHLYIYASEGLRLSELISVIVGKKEGPNASAGLSTGK